MFGIRLNDDATLILLTLAKLLKYLQDNLSEDAKANRLWVDIHGEFLMISEVYSKSASCIKTTFIIEYLDRKLEISDLFSIHTGINSMSLKLDGNTLDWEIYKDRVVKDVFDERGLFSRIFGCFNPTVY
jgi:hypothetical protein